MRACAPCSARRACPSSDQDLEAVHRPGCRGQEEPDLLVFLRYLRTLYPPERRLGIVLDNVSPHLSTRDDPRVAEWAAANNVELASTPTNASWLNRIEAQFQALRYFTLDGTDHASHQQQASMIRRYIAWRNRNAHDRRFRKIIDRANIA
jgi:transposase